MSSTKNKTANPIDVYQLVKKWMVNSTKWTSLLRAENFASNDLERLSAALSALISTLILWRWRDGETLGRHESIQGCGSVQTVRNAVDLLKQIVAAPDAPDFLNLAASIFENLPATEQARIEEVIVRLNSISPEHREVQSIYAEGFNRDAAMYTPKELGLFLWSLAGRPKRVAVLALAGTGLISGLVEKPANCRVKIVFPPQRPDQSSQAAEPKNRSFLAYEPISMGQAFDYLHSKLLPFTDECDTLLVNASIHDILLCAESEYARLNGVDWVDGVFQGKYARILAIVPNQMLSTAQGPNKAADVFQRCMQRGLSRVIELPSIIGRDNQRYCVLEFLPREPVEKIEFIVIPGKDTAPVQSGLGHLRRRFQLFTGFNQPGACGVSPNAQSITLTPKEVLDGSRNPNGLTTTRKSASLKSFEPARFVSVRLQQRERSPTAWGRVGDNFKVHRSQHLKTGADEAMELIEISAGNVGTYGELRDLKAKVVFSDDDDTLHKNRLRQGDIILCVKGAVGKVALIEQEPEVITMTNQSFVVLRSVNDFEEGSELIQWMENVFWWMMSDCFQGYLKSRIVSVGVPRVPISDIYELPLPRQSNDMLLKERKKYLNWKGRVRTMLAIEKKIEVMRRMGWSGNADWQSPHGTKM